MCKAVSPYDSGLGIPLERGRPGRAVRFAPVLMLGSGISQYVGASLAVGLFAVAPALSVAWGRVLAGGLIMLAWRRSIPRLAGGGFDWRAFGKAALFGAILGAMNLCFYVAIDHISLGTAVALEYLGPVLLAALTGRGWKVRLRILLAGTGVFLISCWVGVDLSDPQVAIGVGFAFLAGLFWAFYIWVGRKVAMGGRGLDLLAGPCAWLHSSICPWGHPASGRSSPIGSCLFFLVCVGALSSALPYGIDQIVMKSLPAATVALLNSLLPVTSVLVGLVMLELVPNWAEVAGIALVSVAVALATSPAPPETSRAPIGVHSARWAADPHGHSTEQSHPGAAAEGIVRGSIRAAVRLCRMPPPGEHRAVGERTRATS